MGLSPQLPVRECLCPLKKRKNREDSDQQGVNLGMERSGLVFRAGPECPSFSLSTCSPTFSLFSWHTCLLGVASCLLMMFLISPGAAGGSLLLMGLLCALLTARGGPSSWGYVSQALLFHQVGGSQRRVGRGGGSLGEPTLQRASSSLG